MVLIYCLKKGKNRKWIKPNFGQKSASEADELAVGRKAECIVDSPRALTRTRPVTDRNMLGTLLFYSLLISSFSTPLLSSLPGTSVLLRISFLIGNFLGVVTGMGMSLGRK